MLQKQGAFPACIKRRHCSCVVTRTVLPMAGRLDLSLIYGAHGGDTTGMLALWSDMSVTGPVEFEGHLSVPRPDSICAPNHVQIHLF